MAEDSRAHYAQVPGALCGPAEEPPGQGGPVPVQEHLSTGTSNMHNFIVWPFNAKTKRQMHGSIFVCLYMYIVNKHFFCT